MFPEKASGERKRERRKTILLREVRRSRPVQAAEKQNDTPSAPQDDAQQTGSDASSADTATVQNDATVYAGTGILAAIAAAFVLLRKKMGRAERH